MNTKNHFRRIEWLCLVFVIFFASAHEVRAHCDTMNGPVVEAARLALNRKDVTPVLKWVKKEHEAEVRNVFEKTLVVRGLGKAAQEVADMYFFETVVRVHREGEGEPYTGIKPADTPIEPGIEHADHALETGEIDGLVKDVGQEISSGLRKRFARVQELQKKAEQSVDSGRAYVAAYVEYIHFVESMLKLLEGSHHGSNPESLNQ